MTSSLEPKITGRLFVAELGTDPPDMTVEDATFAAGWRKPWVPAGTVYVKPIELRPDVDRRDYSPDFGEWHRRCFPRYQLVLPPTVDVDEWPAKYRPDMQYRPPSIYEVKFMLGVESVDRRERIICRQVRSVAWPRVFAPEIHTQGAFTMYFAATYRAEDQGVLHRIVAGPDGETAA